jgi:hypothetical protein
VLRIEADAVDVRDRRRHQLEALATLARRSCQAAREATGYYLSPSEWAISVARGFDVLQSQFLEVRSLAAELGGREAAAAKEAFDSFLNAADRVNILGDTRAKTLSDQPDELQNEALFNLGIAEAKLYELSPTIGAQESLPRGYAKMIEEYKRHF